MDTKTLSIGNVELPNYCNNRMMKGSKPQVVTEGDMIR